MVMIWTQTMTPRHSDSDMNNINNNDHDNNFNRDMGLACPLADEAHIMTLQLNKAFENHSFINHHCS